MKVQSLAALFLSQVKRYGDEVLYRFVKDGEWQSYSWNEAYNQAREIGLGLLSLGLKQGERITLFSANRVEWSLIDWGNICTGLLTVPIYASSTPTEVYRIVEHSGSTALFVESANRLRKLDASHPSLRELRWIVVLEEKGMGDVHVGGEAKIITLAELQGMGREIATKSPDEFDRHAMSRRPEEDLTIIYTSGTTGEPKGVLTTHAHYLFEIEAASDAIHSMGREVILQFLPFAHSFGRLEHFMVVALGCTCGFARSMETLGKDFLAVRPTVIFSVPRIYENVYARIHSRVAAGSRWRRFIFSTAVRISKEYSKREREKSHLSWMLRLARKLAHVLAFSGIHRSFGDRLRLAISGGAALSPEIAEFFQVVGILILEGYGLTESSTVSHVNRFERYKFGTVGLPLQGVECRIAGDGEVLLRGPNIFKGYYRDLEATREVVDSDGWFHSGDVGEIDADGFLRITDRKKDLIVTSGGKKIAPQAVENLLKSDPWISQAMVLGDGQSHLLALVSLNRGQVKAWAESKGIKLHDREDAEDPRVIARLREKIAQKNKDLAPFERIRDFRILPQDFAVESGELTPTLKLRRQVISERYKNLVEGMFHKPSYNAREGK